MTRTPRPTTGNQARIDRWNAFLAWVDVHSDSSWVFRGLGDVNFSLISGAGRIGNYRLADEKVVLEIFDKRSAEFIDLRGLNKWDRMAIAQHHGLPTRLLDWTTNPLVGAYFASSSAPGYFDVVDAGGKTFRALRDPVDVAARVVAFRVRSDVVIDPTREPDPFTRDDIGFLLPRSITTRIVTQGGLFSYHPMPATAWAAPLSRTKDVFDIPGNMRDFFRRRLFYLGIDPQRIMGGLDGIGGRLAWQYNTRIGLGAVR